MSLVTLKELMKDAQKNNYAVGAYNVINWDMIRGIILAAEQERSPVIISLAETHCSFVPIDIIAEIMLKEAKLAKVPVAVHLDHGVDFSLLIHAMKLGFSSVMFDGAHLSFEGNVHQTREIVKIAKALNISVEAELGILSNNDNYTDPLKAKEFIEKTEIDALAIAFGTAHGLYLDKPLLDFTRLQQIKNMTNMPLVMHGGSGLENEEYSKSIDFGINKINYYSYMAYTTANIVRDKLKASYNIEKIYYHDISQWTISEIKDHVATTMGIFGSSKKV